MRDEINKREMKGGGENHKGKETINKYSASGLQEEKGIGFGKLATRIENNMHTGEEGETFTE